MADYDDRPGTAAYDERTAAAPRTTYVRTHGSKNILDWLAIILLIVGGLNWGLVGLLGLDVVSLFFGSGTLVSRVIYVAIGVAGLWGFALMRLSPAHRHA